MWVCCAQGVRIVLVLLSGRPLVLRPDTLGALDALVAAWLPGTEGDGIADVLFGRTPFSGRLGFAWPRTNEQATRAARWRTAGRRGRDDPLFALGFGLSTSTREKVP